MPKHHKPSKRKASKARLTGTLQSRARLVPVKCTHKGCRLSASYYYNVECRGKLSKCCPQYVHGVLKRIRIVNGAHGKHPRWVNA